MIQLTTYFIWGYANLPEKCKLDILSNTIYFEDYNNPTRAFIVYD